MFDEIFVRDIVDLTWELHRLIRLRTALLKQRVSDEMERKLKRFDVDLDEDGIAEMIRGWAMGEPEAIGRIQRLLAECGLKLDSITAEALASELELFERLDRMIATATARRNVSLRELDRHRGLISPAPRQVIEQSNVRSLTHRSAED